MASEPFPNSNIQFPLPLALPSNEPQGILEALNSHSTFKNIDNLGSDIGRPELDMDFVSDVMNSTFLEKFSNSRSGVGDDTDAALANLLVPPGAYTQSPGKTNIEPYMSLPQLPMSYSSNNPVSIFSVDDTLSYLCQGAQKERIKQQWESVASSTDLNKSKLQNLHNSYPVQMKMEPLTPTSKKLRCDVNQENIEHQQQQQQQQMIQDLLLTELHECNPQLMAMIEQHRLQNQLQPAVLHSALQVKGPHPQLAKQLPNKQTTSVWQDQGDQQGTFAPLLDGGICSRRFRQYLIRLRSHIHDNNIGCWKKFVSEYYAPGSKMRWCFSNYENIELQLNGVFCPKSMERWCCDLCGSKSGKGLEAIFDVFPRLFKAKFESGILDEMFFLDSPRACKISSGLMLEYGRAIQETVYEKFRVVHEGKLHVVFRNDLKILSWEFCAKNHEEYLLRELVTPQINQMVSAAKKYLESIQNGTPSRISLKELKEDYEMFDSARNQLASSIELPLVNALGYPKRFIRCLQIAEVVDNMTDLMTLSYGTRTGPVECLNNYSQISTMNALEKQRMELLMATKNLPTFANQSGQSGPRQNASGSPISRNSQTTGSGNLGLALANLNRRLLGESYNIASLTRKGPETCFVDPSNQINFTQSFNALRQNVLPSYTLPRSQSAAEPCKSPNKSIFDKLLQEMISVGKGKSVQETYGKPNSEAARQWNASKGLRCGGESSNAASAEVNSADIIRPAANIPKVPSHGDIPVGSRSIAVKAESPASSEVKPEAQQNSATGSSKMQIFKW